MRKMICQGCGATLQDEFPNEKGYIPLLDPSKGPLYCKRCYRLMHYNELPKIIASNAEYEEVINDLLKRNGLIVLVVDLFDFTGTFIPAILSKLKNKDVLLVANKLDLLPKSANVSKIVDWLSYMVNRMFFKVSAIHVVSSKKGLYLEDLMNTIDFLRGGKDVYFMGCANVGKSSLINALIKKFTSRVTDTISTSSIPGTTLSQINVPFFEDNKAFIDTPGLINEHNILSNLLPDSYDMILPKNEIKPITYQLQNDNSILVGGMMIISLIEGENVGFTCYFSDKVTLHRRKTLGLEEFLNKHNGTLLTPPIDTEVKDLKYDTKEFQVKNDKKYELVMSGLGFVSFSKGCKIRVKYIKNTDVFIRNAILGKN